MFYLDKEKFEQKVTVRRQFKNKIFWSGEWRKITAPFCMEIVGKHCDWCEEKGATIFKHFCSYDSNFLDRIQTTVTNYLSPEFRNSRKKIGKLFHGRQDSLT